MQFQKMVTVTFILLLVNACSGLVKTQQQQSANLEDGQTPRPESLRQIIDSVEGQILTLSEVKNNTAEIAPIASAPVEESAEVKSAFDLEINNEVNRWIEYFTVRDADRFQRFLVQGERYRNVVQSILEENDLPNELYYLGIIESGFSNHAKSRARAVGAWQFMKGTARLYGLDVNNFVDERKDPIRATESAARYLGDLYKMFNSWELALAAYNSGPGRVLKAIKKGQSKDYWELVRLKVLPRETRHYLPKFIAAVIIGQNPEKFGLTEPAKLDDKTYPSVEAVEVPGLIRLTDIAQKAEIPLEILKDINPHLKKGVTPPVKTAYELWVPKNFASQVASLSREFTPLTNGRILADSSERPNLEDSNVHRVRRGESLYQIAQLYGISVNYLKEINNIESNNIRVGQKIRLHARSYLATPEGGHYYKVRTGDSLEKIARRYSVSLEKLKEVNNLSQNRIYAKQKLVIPKGQHHNLPTARPVVSYVVRAGDTLNTIANRFEMSVRDLKNINNLQKSKLRIGQTLFVSSAGAP